MGGKTLDALEGKENPLDSHFPEDWIASTTRAMNPNREDVMNEGLSTILFNRGSAYLKDVLNQYHEETIGTAHFQKYRSNTGFLLKYLDSSIRLHMQCHPTITFAKKYLNSDSGKTEAYVILDTRNIVKQPYIFLGFQKPPNREELKRNIKEQNIKQILSYFEKIPVKAGDVFLVPGGLPHAIGEGIFMIEIMEPTDFGVRIEFERGGYTLPGSARFMDRGIDFAISMFNFQSFSVQEVKEKFFFQPRFKQYLGMNGYESVLIAESDTDCFSVKKLVIEGEVHWSKDTFYVGVVVEGQGQATFNGGTVQLNKYDKFFVPFKADTITYKTEKQMEIILALPPK